MLVDVHAHLYFDNFKEDIKEVLKRAESAGVTCIINAGVDHETNLKALELSKKNKILNASLGVYPTETLRLSEKELEKEIEFIRSNKSNILGIGEIGLDFKESKEEKEHKKQMKAFEKILTSLNDLNLPFIIHSRKAEKECIEILEKLKIKKVIFHCFCGKFSLVKRIQKNNWFASIPANIDKSEHFQGMVKILSINNILTETDAPYLTPRGELRSEPAFVKGTINKIAEIKNMNANEVENNIYLNYQKLFL